MCESFGKDLIGMYESYYNIATSNVSQKNTDKNWIIFNENTYSSVKKIEISFVTIKEEILKNIEDIKRYIGIRNGLLHHRTMNLFNSKANLRFENRGNSRRWRKYSNYIRK